MSTMLLVCYVEFCTKPVVDCGSGAWVNIGLLCPMGGFGTNLPLFD